ncbi:MAG: glucose-1-phosphate cytidylyltransferase [Planctomycetota bacterium]
MRVVILAGGLGTRLAERTDGMPKPLVEIGGMPVLWHILKIYAHHGFADFVIACGYKAQAVKRFFLEERERASDLVIDYASDHVEYLRRSDISWRVSLIDTGLHTATGGRLRRLRSHLADRAGPGTFLMTYGDGVADVDLRRLVAFHRDHGRLATFTATHPPSNFGRPELCGDRVVAFHEKPDDRDAWINGGFFVLEPEVLDAIAGDDTSFEHETLPRLAGEGELMAYRHDGFWQPMDTLRDVRNLNEIWQTGEAPWKVWTA